MKAPINFYEYITNIIDSNLTKWGTPEQYESLTHEQTQIIQALKRLSKRLKK